MMRLPHDDQMRQALLRRTITLAPAALRETGSNSEQVSKAKPRNAGFNPAIIRRRAQVAGGGKAFRQLVRQLRL